MTDIITGDRVVEMFKSRGWDTDGSFTPSFHLDLDHWFIPPFEEISILEEMPKDTCFWEWSRNTTSLWPSEMLPDDNACLIIPRLITEGKALAQHFRALGWTPPHETTPKEPFDHALWRIPTFHEALKLSLAIWEGYTHGDGEWREYSLIGACPIPKLLCPRVPREPDTVSSDEKHGETPMTQIRWPGCPHKRLRGDTHCTVCSFAASWRR